MSSSNDLRMQLAIAQMNVNSYRQQIEEADKRILELQDALAQGNAPANAEHTLAGIIASRMTYQQQLQGWEPELKRLQDLMAGRN